MNRVTRRINRNGPIPLYYQLREIILEAIERKEFKPGEWHDYRVLVRGNHHQHWIDRLASAVSHPDALDSHPAGFGVDVHFGHRRAIAVSRRWADARAFAH